MLARCACAFMRVDRKHYVGLVKSVRGLPSLQRALILIARAAFFAACTIAAGAFAGFRAAG